MQTLPSSWHTEPISQPERFGQRLPMPWQSVGRTHAGGASVMAGPEIAGALPPTPLVPAALVPPLPALPPLVEPPLLAAPSSFLLQPPVTARRKPSVATADQHQDVFMFRFSTGRAGALRPPTID